MKIKYLYIGALALLSACNTSDEALLPTSAIEFKGITASIDNGAVTTTRAVPEVKNTIGRTAFANGDKIVFTKIERTDNPIDPFKYGNIPYEYDGKNWNRTTTDPEKIYWTDGTSFHTFIGYSLPSAISTWKPDANGDYAGELGEAGNTEIDFSSLKEGNNEMAKHDLLLYYNKDEIAESDGVTTNVKLTHALSNVRVIVNIKNFAASSDATDVQTTVSDFKILNQPAKYTWGGGSNKLTVVDYEKNERKTIKLWCPKPEGDGTAQSKTFTFYGLTTPQDEKYHANTDNQKYLQFSFIVAYPDPMNPNGTPLVKTYQGTFDKLVQFNSGQCTTLNISLNHKDEQMFIGAEYSDWSFVASPDQGELRKKSTYMATVDDSAIKTKDQVNNADDANWLYTDGGKVYDIYGNDGSTAANAYCITSALQMLAFAKEVNSGNTFVEQFVRLDADITMQSNTAKTSAEDENSNITPIEWIGIGDVDHAFNGTFLGGDRYINRLYGKPLFINLGALAVVEQLHIAPIGTITGGGALAETNAGTIGGCKVVEDVTTTGGALVGTNSGTIYACYHIGTTTGIGGLVGTNTGTGKVIGCYQAGDVVGGTSYGIVGTNEEGGTINCPEATSIYQIQQKDFVEALNKKLTEWNLETKFQFVHNSASYPTVTKDTTKQ